MRLEIAMGCLLAGVAIAPPALAASDGMRECRQARDPHTRLAACSRVIDDRSATAEDKGAAYRQRGAARLRAGAFDQAAQDLSAAIGLAPDDAHGYLLRARAHMGRSALDAAIADYGHAVSRAPASVEAFSGRGHAYMIKGDVTAALADLTRAVGLNPKSASALNNRGLAFRRAGDLERALADYTGAINLNPIYALAYNNRGYVHEARGNKPEAIADFRRALLLDPSLAGARDGLARLGASGVLAAESASLVREGKSLAQAHCSRCHAIEERGDSPLAKAPPFRDIQDRHPDQALREPLTRGIAAPHDEMPAFRLADSQVDRIVAYINSLPKGR